eukprot:COSAG01_NODE_990_length_12289_cov_22.606545_15_plen_104_part_00
MLRRHPWHLTSGSAGRSAPSEQFSLKLVPCAHLRRIFSKLDEEEEAEESLDTYHVTYEFGNRCVHTIPHCPLLTAATVLPSPLRCRLRFDVSSVCSLVCVHVR